MSSQAPTKAGTANTAYLGRSRSPRSRAASTIAMSGWSFCSTCGVIGSPSRKAAVESAVARADDPAPMTSTDALVRRDAAARRRAEGRSHGLTSTARIRCSQKTTASPRQLAGQRPAPQGRQTPQRGGQDHHPSAVGGVAAGRQRRVGHGGRPNESPKSRVGSSAPACVERSARQDRAPAVVRRRVGGRDGARLGRTFVATSPRVRSRGRRSAAAVSRAGEGCDRHAHRQQNHAPRGGRGPGSAPMVAICSHACNTPAPPHPHPWHASSEARALRGSARSSAYWSRNRRWSWPGACRTRWSKPAVT